MAEAYWDMEWTLQQQGFDLCYDKRLYDRLVARSSRRRTRTPAGRRRLPGAADPLHREPRRATRRGHLRAGAGARGGGRDVHAAGRAALPRRPAGGPADARSRCSSAVRPDEPADSDLRAFYERLLRAVADSDLREGDWTPVRVQRLARQRLLPAARRLVLVDAPGHATSWWSTSPPRRPRHASTHPGRIWPDGRWELADLLERTVLRARRRRAGQRRPVRRPRRLGIALPVIRGRNRHGRQVCSLSADFGRYKSTALALGHASVRATPSDASFQAPRLALVR